MPRSYWSDRTSDYEAVYGPDEEELDRRRPRVSPGKRTLVAQLARAVAQRGGSGGRTGASPRGMTAGAVQRRASGQAATEPERVEEIAAAGVQGGGEPLPHLEADPGVVRAA